MKTILITPPASLPVSLADMKEHCVVDPTFAEDDDLITGLIDAAAKYTEQYLGCKLITQTYKLLLDCWPVGDKITIPFCKCSEITSVKYTDEDSVEDTFSSSLYIKDTDSVPARAVLVTGETWPSDVLLNVNPITVQFITGYGVAGDVPTPICQAIKLLVGHWYLHREAVVIGQVPRMLRLSVDSLLGPFRKDGGLI